MKFGDDYVRLPKRVRNIVISCETLAFLLTGSEWRVCGGNLPTDAQVLSLWFDRETLSMMMTVSSELYAVVPEGEVIPRGEFEIETRGERAS